MKILSFLVLVSLAVNCFAGKVTTLRSSQEVNNYLLIEDQLYLKAGSLILAIVDITTLKEKGIDPLVFAENIISKKNMEIKCSLNQNAECEIKSITSAR